MDHDAGDGVSRFRIGDAARDGAGRCNERGEALVERRLDTLVSRGIGAVVKLIWVGGEVKQLGLAGLCVADVLKLRGPDTPGAAHEVVSAATKVAGSGFGPAAEQQDLGAWLRELVEALPTSLREVVDLWLDGFSHSEIAEITDRTPGHVRVLVHRALTRLREHPRTRELLAEDSSPKKLSQPTN